MRYCDLTLLTPEANLAAEEALIDWCEARDPGSILRFWEPASFFVVVGYANAAATEVNLSYCDQNGIPVLRRCSGGGTVLQGPGCLNYALFLRVNDSPALESITGTNSFVMQRHRTALSDLLGREVQQQGHTDLALDGRKFCGNAQRRRKNYVLFHGCFLLGLDIGAIEQALPLPSKRPEYRRDRTHRDFLVNLNLPPAALKEALRRAWGATEPLEEFPLVQTEALVRERYSLREWNRKF